MHTLARALATTAIAVPLLALASPASAAPTSAAEPGTPTTMSAACGKKASDIDRSSYVAPGTAVNQRSGSSTSCGTLGVLQASDKADYYCFTIAGSATWTYLRNTRTNVVGWVLDANLADGGSLTYCGF